jgi:hypothetical protein
VPSPTAIWWTHWFSSSHLVDFFFTSSFVGGIQGSWVDDICRCGGVKPFGWCHGEFQICWVCCSFLISMPSHACLWKSRTSFGETINVKCGGTLGWVWKLRIRFVVPFWMIWRWFFHVGGFMSPFSMDAFKLSFFQLLYSLEQSIWSHLIPLDGGSLPYCRFGCTCYVENMGRVCCFGGLRTASDHFLSYPHMNKL